VFGGSLNVLWSHSRCCIRQPFWRYCCHCGGQILLRGPQVGEVHLRTAQAPDRAADHGLGRRAGSGLQLQFVRKPWLAPGEPASGAIRTTALMRH
jgi:hypothetical protein